MRITRKEYLTGKCSHREYYAQLVNISTIEAVKDNIGLDKIINSDNEHFNDIPLKYWDNCPVFVSGNILKELGESFTLSVKVCIAKEAAKQIKETSKK